MLLNIHFNTLTANAIVKPYATARRVKFQSFLRPFKVLPGPFSVGPRIANGLRKENKRRTILMNFTTRLLSGSARGRLSAYLALASSICPFASDSGIMNQTRKEYKRCRLPARQKTERTWPLKWISKPPTVGPSAIPVAERPKFIEKTRDLNEDEIDIRITL